MHISDWSSGVCSSDLAESETSAGKEKVKAQPNGNPNYVTPATAKRSNGHGLFPIAIGRTRPEQVMLVVTGHGAKQVGAQGMGKIGRASCRERVCQYV